MTTTENISRRFVYGWDLTCRVCRIVLYEGMEVWVEETRTGGFVGAECLIHRPTS